MKWKLGYIGYYRDLGIIGNSSVSVEPCILQPYSRGTKKLNQPDRKSCAGLAKLYHHEFGNIWRMAFGTIKFNSGSSSGP